MKVFLYCAIGLERYKRECIYSMPSLYRQMDKFSKDKIVVITDVDKWFEPYHCLINFEVIKLNENIIDKWTLGGKYMYRCKIESMRYCFDLYKTDIVFLDTDTVILNKNICHIFESLGYGHFYMHSACTPVDRALKIVDEIKFSDINYLSLKRIFFYKSIEHFGFIYQNEYPISTDFVPYNSGIIALSYSDRNLISQVEAVSDCIYERYGYDCAEEFGFSYVFQLNGNIITVEDDIFHYPEAKFVRHLVAEVLNIKILDDEKIGKELFATYEIDNIGELNLTISEIPSFVRFLLVYSAKTHKELELKSLEEVYTYVNFKSSYYSTNNTLACYKKYYTRIKHINQN